MKPPLRRDLSFSKFSKRQKIDYIVQHHLNDSREMGALLESFWHFDPEKQDLFDHFSENTLSNFYVPYGVCPGVLINEKIYCVPMAIEESSVVAAAAMAAKFWRSRGGVKAEVLSTKKIGQVHLSWGGQAEKLQPFFCEHKEAILHEITPLTSNMKQRGGGLCSVDLLNKTQEQPGYFQLWCEFETCEAMGANFINTVLEALGQAFAKRVCENFQEHCEVIMAILSNYTPDSCVKAFVRCPIVDLEDPSVSLPAPLFAEKIKKAVHIAKIDPHRAVTHNKGIFNAVDAVVMATGNDFRAVEACGHSFAARDGQYRGLSECSLMDDHFLFSLTLPLAIGTVGGLTSLHPLARLSFDLLGRPGVHELMEITVAMGLIQNFAALKSLVTTGIQKGHMKMHLMNILHHLECSREEREKAMIYFQDKVVSFKAVRHYIGQLRWS